MTLTPIENRNGLWLKREDLHRGPYGINGAKYRACQYLIGQARARGFNHVISAASVLSPQSAMGAVIAAELGMECTVIVGGTTPMKAMKHPSIEIAARAGADIRAIAVGYNPALQRAAIDLADRSPGAWRLPYGITTPPGSTLADVEDFVRVGAPQTANLPDQIETLVLPFGSGNTATGVLYGLHDQRPSALRRVLLMGIGPSRLDWARERLADLGRAMTPRGVELIHVPLHPQFATYGVKMHETLEGVRLHPTYEGKIARYLNQTAPDWWTRRDGKAALWIVGGPV